MMTTDLLVCISLIGVTTKPAHDFNICVMSEGEKGREKDTARLRCKTTLLYTLALLTVTVIHSQINIC